MRCSLLRWGVCSAILLAAYAASAYTFPNFDPFAAYEALAQEEFEEQAATPTPTPSPDSEVLPTPSPTPEPTATVSSREPTATSTAEAEPTPAPTRTPVPPSELPELTEERDEVGTVVEAEIDEGGGRISSPDGRVTVDIPEGATDERLTVAISTRKHRGLDPMRTYSPFVGVWEFSATSLDRDGADVSSFERPLLVTVRFSPEDLVWHNPQTLAYWTRDDESRPWTRVPAVVDAGERTITVEVDHFSEHGATADELVNTAPLLDGRNTNLNSGSATLNIPLVPPPGRGGLTPQVNLSYDSGRLGEMRKYTNTSGWVGMGWALDTGSIVRDSQQRLWLNMGGIAGELMLNDAAPEAGRYRLANDRFLHIVDEWDCLGSNLEMVQCEVVVTDKDGIKYVFGGGSEYTRWTVFHLFGNWGHAAYQLDLARIEDPHGNSLVYTYWRDMQSWPECSGGNCAYPAAAYPATIEYNHAGGDPEVPLARVRFVNACDETPTSPNICMRYDTPRDVPEPECFPAYSAPLVLETRRLTDVIMEVRDGQSWEAVRTYRLGYNLNDPAIHFHMGGTCTARAGHNLLINLQTRDRTDQSTLNTMTFGYELEPHAYKQSSSNWYSYELPHLAEAGNGFGGTVLFEYEERDAGTPFKRWTRSVVVSETHVAGAGQPNVTREYEYGPGPVSQPHLYPHPIWALTHDPFNASYRGFAEAVEVDAVGNRTEHAFYTMANYDDTDKAWDDYQQEVLAGLEYEVVRRDAGGAVWQRVDTAHGIRPIGAYWGAHGKPHYHYINFVHPESVTTTLRDQTELRTNYEFDDWGNLELVHDEGVPGDAGDDTYTHTPHHWNLTDWIFAPKYEQVSDLRPDDQGTTVLSRTNLYYDGADDWATAPAVGRLTAVSTRLNATETSTTYSVYDAFGNVVEQSVPSATPPELYFAGSSLGWIPAGLPSAETEFDPDHRVYPVLITDILEHETEFQYDFVIGRPTRVDEPNGRFVEIRYDGFGRTTKAWDNLDTEQYPTVSFTYNWGTGANRTYTQRRSTHHSAGAQRSVVCADGFGREYQVIEAYLGTLTNRIRIDYDSRGLRSVETRPVANHTSLTCPGSPAPVEAADRVVYKHDPLGNVIETTAIPANESSGPSTTSTHDGLTSTFTDEKLNVTTHVSDPAARTLTVIEPGSPGPETVYEYDRLGQLVKVTDDAGNVTTVAYDLAGRKTSMSDPDMGAWSYGYNAAGSLTQQTDARGITTMLAYDDAQRLLTKTYSNEEPTVEYEYDTYPDANLCDGAAPPFALVTLMTDGAGERLSCYDIRGREITTRRTVDSVAYDVHRTFQPLGDVKELTYPDGEKVLFDVYPSGGQLRSVASVTESETFASQIYYAPSHATQSLLLGTGQTTSYLYDFRGRLDRIQTTTVQDVSFTYDDASNVKTVTDSITSETAVYSYDELHRLTGMSLDGTPVASYTYNSIGNLLTKQEGASSLTLSYPSPGNPRPHAVTSVSGSETNAFKYDQNGNLAGTFEHSYGFDAENRITR
jgi:YD repeat-containing protein